MQACWAAHQWLKILEHKEIIVGRRSGHYKLEEENYVKKTDASPRTVYGVQREQS